MTTDFQIDVQFPNNFERLNNTEPQPEISLDDTGELVWYLTIFGRPNNTLPFKEYILKWKPGTVAEIVHPSTFGETDARGSIGVHDSGGVLFSWQGSGNFPRLIAQNVPGFNPAPPDKRVTPLIYDVSQLSKRVDALTATATAYNIKVNALEIKIQQLSDAIANMSIALSEDDVKALKWVKDNTTALIQKVV